MKGRKMIGSLLSACLLGVLYPAVVSAQVDGVNKNYENSKFLWTDNYVVEGNNAAMAPNPEEIVTTCLSKDGKPLRWVRKNDIYRYGRYTGRF